MTEQELEQQIANLDKAIGSGTRQVRDAAGNSLEYQSIDDMLKAKQTLQGQLSKLRGRPKVKHYQIMGGKGY